jgi:hypothetical protein
MTDPQDAFEKALYPAIERLIEQDYPNPPRKGCPDHSLLEKAATSPAGLSEEEKAAFVAHIVKCWPCFKDLKRLREIGSKKPQD